MYACGVTVYDYSHLGHARGAVAFDLIQRYFRRKGFEVKYVRNFTDVDDKIINRAKEEGITAAEVAHKYIDAYEEDMKRLGVGRADIEPKATEHIPEMIEVIKGLVEKGMPMSWTATCISAWPASRSTASSRNGTSRT